MNKQKQRPQVGDEAWFVEWCYELAFYDDDPNGDVDRDNCKNRTHRVATREEAERLAHEVYPQTVSTFGIVSYWPARFVPYDEADALRYPHVGYWEAADDSEYYEGE